jgi:hypothetical protein
MAVAEANSGKLLAKRKKIGEQYSELTRGEEAAECDNDLMVIIKELMREPKKLKPCRRAVLSEMFLAPSEEIKQASFPPTYIYMARIPKQHIQKELFGKLSVKLTEAYVQSCTVADKAFCHKMLYASCFVEGSMKLPSHSKEIVNEELVQRHQRLGGWLTSLETEKEICWESQGIWFLIPEIDPLVEPPVGHKYTHVRLRHRPTLTFALPSSINVTGWWTITDNYSFQKAALASPTGKKPIHHLPIISFLETEEEWLLELISGLPVWSDKVPAAPAAIADSPAQESSSGSDRPCLVPVSPKDVLRKLDHLKKLGSKFA